MPSLLGENPNIVPRPETTRDITGQDVSQLLRGSASAPFTLAPDLLGLLGLPISGDPIREFAGVDPTSGFGLLGEFLDPTSGAAKVLKAASLLGVPKSIGVGVRTGQFNVPASGSGKRGQVLKEDAARTLENIHGGLLGRRVADPTTTRGMNNMVARGIDDVEFQLGEPITGQGWYDADIAKTFQTLESRFDPRFADPDIQQLWTGVAAPTSFGTPVPRNANVATQIMENYLATGRIPVINPQTGKLWTMRSSSKQGLEVTQHLLDKFGLEGYNEFMLSPQRIGDLAQIRKESGAFTAGRPLTAYRPNIPGKLDDEVLGAYILGPKGGPFMLNLNGINDTTVDLWQMRNYNRNRGKMLDNAGALIDAPQNHAVRDLAKEYTRRVAEPFGLSEQDTQAIQWYFEQQLFDQMGVRGAIPKAFSEGVEALATQRGLPIR